MTFLSHLKKNSFLTFCAACSIIAFTVQANAQSSIYSSEEDSSKQPKITQTTFAECKNSFKDSDDAKMACFQKIAERGDIEANNFLAQEAYHQAELDQESRDDPENAYDTPSSQDNNLLKAAKYWERAAKLGSNEARDKLALFYYSGKNIHADTNEHDYQTAFYLWQAAANNGDIQAEFRLGTLYQEGKGIQQNYQEAKKWFEKSALQGNIDAQNALGDLYLNGQAGSIDEKEAFKYYLQSASQGSAYGQNALGKLYANSNSFGKDQAQAVIWWQKAANQNNAAAQDSLAFAYGYGLGTQEDDAKAITLWQKASAHDDFPMAKFHLGMFYIHKNEHLNDAADLLAAALDADYTPKAEEMPASAQKMSLKDFLTNFYEKSCDQGDALSCANYAKMFRPDGL